MDDTSTPVRDGEALTQPLPIWVDSPTAKRLLGGVGDATLAHLRRKRYVRSCKVGNRNLWMSDDIRHLDERIAMVEHPREAKRRLR